MHYTDYSCVETFGRFPVLIFSTRKSRRKNYILYDMQLIVQYRFMEVPLKPRR
jgi:hypothetical protein